MTDHTPITDEPTPEDGVTYPLIDNWREVNAEQARHTPLTDEDCSCSPLSIQGAPRNWNPECSEHGVKSRWYRSPEQVEKRRAQSERLRSLQRQAREARQAAQPMTDHTPLTDEELDRMEKWAWDGRVRRLIADRRASRAEAAEWQARYEGLLRRQGADKAVSSDG